MIKWRCQNGHTLGFIMRYGPYNCLVLVDPRLNDLESFAVISGSADVRCLVCGDMRTWRFGDDLLKHLKEQVKS